MRPRGAVLLICFAVSAHGTHAGEMSAEQARRFVVGEVFTFACFEGTQGAGRVFTDGSVAGTIRVGTAGPMRWASLPAGTLRVKGETVCASLRGIPFEPCFRLDRTSEYAFRGSVLGLEFAYCDFTRVGRAKTHAGAAGSRDPAAPLSLDPCAAAAGRARDC